MKLNSIRSRLIISHILPLLLMIPLVGIALVYLLETQVLLPQLAVRLLGDARLLAEITRAEYELWGNPVFFERMLSRVYLGPDVNVMFLTPDGRLLYSNEPEDEALLGTHLNDPGLEQAMQGEEITLTNYSGFRLSNVLIDVFTPVTDSNGEVVGIVRVTYRILTIYDLFSQFRELIAIVLGMALILGAGLGFILAVNISRPVQRVTRTIYEVARGVRAGKLSEQGPEEVRSLSRAVNFLVERLDSLEQSRQHLLANLVHELGRPLGALRAAIHALSQGAAEDPQLLKELTAGMDEEAIRLQRVLDDLAHLHEQVLGSLEMKLEAIGLAEWLPRMLLPWQEAASEKRLQWQTDIPATLPTIRADPVRLEQIIGNLTSNAIKYTPAGKSVHISAGANEKWVWIRVSDTGPGIPPGEQEKIFTPFYRGSQGRRIKQGMGLGLSIARDLVVAHGGRLDVESKPEQGSSFTIWLPLDPHEPIRS